MGRPKKTAPQHVEPENESQEVPDTEPVRRVERAPDAKAISKAEAIRRMLAEGIDNPTVGSHEIKKRFGIELTPQHFSATKAQMKGKEAKSPGTPKGKPGRKPKAAVEGYLAPPPKPQPPGEQPDLLAAMEAMKPLVAALGAEKVKRIADLLG